MKSLLNAFILLFASLLCSVGAAGDKSKTVVFVCEHGSVKSLIAASFFNRLATEQAIPYRAVSRGTAPDAGVPAGIVKNLEKDGFDVANFKPQPLTKSESTDASAVVAFCDISEELADPVKVSQWSDIPPASVDYEKSKAAILRRIDTLLVALKTE